MLTSASAAAVWTTAVFARLYADCNGLNPTDRPLLEPVRMRVAASRPRAVLAIWKSM